VGEEPGQPASGDEVLLVEDDPRIASFLIKGLSAKGFAIDWVMSGQEAIARAEATDYAAVILDLGLPDIDGLEILERWSLSSTPPPVVVLTARSDPRDRARALALGARAYLTKPAPFADLVAAIRLVIDKGSAPSGGTPPDQR
jgi:DNA-binding response OmpR family regulator